MKLLAAFVLLLFAGVCVSAAATPKEEIESLLGYIQHLEGATFIRNGSEYTASQAVSHLRLKWDQQAKKISTAEEFIALCGSKSSMSGERYRIRLKDGTVRFCDELLTEQLGILRKKTKAAKSRSHQGSRGGAGLAETNMFEFRISLRELRASA